MYVLREEGPGGGYGKRREGFIPCTYTARYGTHLADLALGIKHKKPTNATIEPVDYKDGDHDRPTSKTSDLSEPPRYPSSSGYSTSSTWGKSTGQTFHANPEPSSTSQKYDNRTWTNNTLKAYTQPGFAGYQQSNVNNLSSVKHDDPVRQRSYTHSYHGYNNRQTADIRSTEVRNGDIRRVDGRNPDSRTDCRDLRNTDLWVQQATRSQSNLHQRPERDRSDHLRCHGNQPNGYAASPQGYPESYREPVRYNPNLSTSQQVENPAMRPSWQLANSNVSKGGYLFIQV